MLNCDFSREEAELWNRTCRWLGLDEDEDTISPQCVEPAVPEVSILATPRESTSPVVFSPDSWVHDKRQRWIRDALCGLDSGGKRERSRQGCDSGVSLSFDEAGSSDSKKKLLHKKERRKS